MSNTCHEKPERMMKSARAQRSRRDPLPLLLGAAALFQLMMAAAIWTIALAAGLAFAQSPTVVGPPAVPDVDVLALLKAMLSGVQNGNGWLVAGPALTLVVFMVRKYDLMIPKVGPAIDAFLNRPFVAFLLPIAVSSLMGLFSALATGSPIGPALLAALKVAAAAIATYVGAKKAGEQVPVAPAQAAGAEAAKNPGPTLGA